ncbi:MAG TPA: hemolysin III family protein [Stellaceae bacterium]|nr:hemolysin III family protein [Stellaceae bacterium]
MPSSIALRPHRNGELMLDRQVHYIGVTAGTLGTIVLGLAAAASGSLAILASSLAYAAGLMAMLLCSAVYNHRRGSRRRELWRRLDHAAIFVMIAGTYTPFTVNRLPFLWSLTMTTLIWGIAVTGAALKLAQPHLLERVSVLPYLALGWIGLVALAPLTAVLDRETLILLGVGGMLYTLGTLFHLWHRLPFQNAVWHGFVMSAAACHYAAILHGVVEAS